MTAPQKSLKWYRELAEKKGRLNAGVFLVESEKAIRQIMGSQPEAVLEIVSINEPHFDFRKYPARQVSESQFSYISSAQTPQGIAAVIKLQPDIYTTRPPANTGDKILLLEDIQDPGNTGTLIRTAAAFDFSGVILTDKCADPFSPKVVQATAGAVMSLWIRATTQYLELIDSLRAKDYTLISTELGGRDGTGALQQKRFILALGNESSGLSLKCREMADYHVGIPIAREKAESLNAAVCGAILMYLSREK
jgi:RNA methyltransferase, TrmH family